MINITIKESAIIVADPDVTPEPGKVTEKIISSKAIEVLQYPHSNQTLLQDNGHMPPDAVTLLPEQLLELIRQSGSQLQPLLDHYVANNTAELQKYDDLIDDRIKLSSTEELTVVLESRKEFSKALRAKAKGAFYTRQHALFSALCSYLHTSLKLILESLRTDSDDELLELLNRASEYRNRLESFFPKQG
ncbi:MAG: hypothetical protein RSC68_13330 [Acinetobacter sp.]